MIRQINKLTYSLFISILITGCGASKNQNKEIGITFEKYLETRKIDIKTLNPATTIYTDYYLEFLNEEKKQVLSINPYLKVNKVYVYQGNRKVIAFCIYSDEGDLYFAEAYKSGGMLLADPKDGKIQLRKKIKLDFLGFFEIKDTIFKTSRHVKTPTYEMNQSDIGYIKNDTITLTAYYNTRKSGDYKKKWLAKTHKTNYKFIYQPDLIVTKHEGDKTHNPYYLIDGSFNAEIDLEEEKMLRLLEKAKY